LFVQIVDVKDSYIAATSTNFYFGERSVGVYLIVSGVSEVLSFSGVDGVKVRPTYFCCFSCGHQVAVVQPPDFVAQSLDERQRVGHEDDGGSRSAELI
tara:strand:+ start:57 stop:350 length:294 start_codon:yes stop_codon:yes gene_type:complete